MTPHRAGHQIKGEEFPQTAKTPWGSGPELPAWARTTRRSKMPDYSDSLTLKQVVDVVAYLKSLTGTAGEHGGTSAA